MKTVKVNLYSFSELSKEVQKKVITEMWDINVDYEWWKFMYEDAERIGLDITSFNLEYRKITGEFIVDPESVAENLKEYAGPIHALAVNYLHSLESLQANADRVDADEKTENWIEDETNILSDEFKNDLSQIYLHDLQSEYEHLTSEDAIKDTIEANEYLFFQDGKLIPRDLYPKERRSIGQRLRAIIARMRAKFAPVDLVLMTPTVAAIVYAFNAAN